MFRFRVASEAGSGRANSAGRGFCLLQVWGLHAEGFKLVSPIAEQSPDILGVSKLRRKPRNSESVAVRSQDRRDDAGSTASRTAARIYRASIGRLDLDITHILGSREFKRFLSQTGKAITPLTPLFDAGYYLARIPKSLQQDINPVLHFCLHGDNIGLVPTRLFHPEFLASVLRGDISAAVDLVSLFVAVIENVEPPFITPHPLFEPELWVASTGYTGGMNPAADFLATRNFAGKCFSRYFSTRLYAQCRPNVRHGTVNPLLMYLQDCEGGVIEDVNPMLHALFYINKYQLNVSDPLTHYIMEGAAHGFEPNPFAKSELGVDELTLSTFDVKQMYLDYIALPGHERQ